MRLCLPKHTFRASGERNASSVYNFDTLQGMTP